MSEPISQPPTPSPLTLAPAGARPGRGATSGEPLPDPTPPAPRPGRRKRPLTLGGWLIRIGMGLPLLISVGLVVWAYQRLIPVQRQARETASQISRLATEIGLMEGRLTPEELDRLAAEFQRAQGLLFSTPESLKDWLTQLRLQMVPLALEATADVGRPAATNAANPTVAVVPATLSLTLQPSRDVEGVRSPYERVLQFLDVLSREAKRVDVVELQVTGSANSVSRAVVSLSLWAGGQEPAGSAGAAVASVRPLSSAAPPAPSPTL